LIAALVAAVLLDCVPLAQADQFGLIPFSERVRADDPRFLSVECDQDGCTGLDRSGVEYRTDGEWILQKVASGRGPASAFESRLTPAVADENVLTAPVCIEEGGMWLTLDLTISDRPVYKLLAQP
jgi:hypothetical protein